MERCIVIETKGFNKPLISIYEGSDLKYNKTLSYKKLADKLSYVVNREISYIHYKANKMILSFENGTKFVIDDYTMVKKHLNTFTKTRVNQAIFKQSVSNLGITKKNHLLNKIKALASVSLATLAIYGTATSLKFTDRNTTEFREKYYQTTEVISNQEELTVKERFPDVFKVPTENIVFADRKAEIIDATNEAIFTQVSSELTSPQVDADYISWILSIYEMPEVVALNAIRDNISQYDLDKYSKKFVINDIIRKHYRKNYAAKQAKIKDERNGYDKERDLLEVLKNYNFDYSRLNISKEEFMMLCLAIYRVESSSANSHGEFEAGQSVVAIKNNNNMGLCDVNGQPTLEFNKSIMSFEAGVSIVIRALTQLENNNSYNQNLPIEDNVSYFYNPVYADEWSTKIKEMYPRICKDYNFDYNSFVQTQKVRKI